jgi:lipopolysaccharide/colanic/teichoic acid biosynthesis glycosyltransferase
MIAEVEPVPARVSKRVLDVVLASMLLILLSPVFVFALLVLALDRLLVRADRGSWLYSERRISRGRTFDLLKFRVLREAVLEELRGTKGTYARIFERDEANLTKAGRLLKRMYFDELPQLVNVLRGDMSLVGPRPWPVAMVENQVVQGYVYRNHVLAGWTGPAQVSKDSPKRSQATEFDLEYVEACRTMSAGRLLRYDLKLLAESVATMLRGRGLKY